MIYPKHNQHDVGDIIWYATIEAFLEEYGECPLQNLMWAMNREERQCRRKLYYYKRTHHETEIRRGTLYTLTDYKPDYLAATTLPLEWLSMVTRMLGGQLEAPA